MIKILHTADWHLGQTFYNYDRKWEHKAFLDWLIDKTAEIKADVLLICGDVFDNQNPSAEAQSLYYSFLKKITDINPELQIIIIAGNHDSASRLEAPNPLLETMNITVRGLINRDENGEIDFNNLIIPLRKGGNVLAVQYLRQGDYPSSKEYGLGVENMYKELYQRVNKDERPIISLGHLHAINSSINENDRSERIIMGELDNINLDVFDNEIDYLALGHLHRHQRVGGKENFRYSGSPLPMSFAEKNYKHGVVLVNYDKEVEIEFIPYPSPIELISIPDRPQELEEVLEAINTLPEGKVDETTSFLEIKVLITEVNPEMRISIENALKNKKIKLCRIESIHPKRDNNSEGKEPLSQDLRSIEPMEMALSYYKKLYDNEMPEDLEKMLRDLVIKTKEEI
ncbi:MAG: exonuclease SbcCD subunit D [Bacteroidales bacterium]